MYLLVSPHLCNDPEYACDNEKVCSLVGDNQGVCVDPELVVARNKSHWINHNGKYIVGNKSAIETLSGILGIKVPGKKEFMLSGNELNERGNKLNKLVGKFKRVRGDNKDLMSLPEDSLGYIQNIKAEFKDIPFHRSKLPENTVVEEKEVDLDDLLQAEGEVVEEDVQLDDLLGGAVDGEEIKQEPVIGELDISQRTQVEEPEPDVRTQPRQESEEEVKEEVKQERTERADQEHVDEAQVVNLLSNISSGNKTDIKELDEVQQKILKCLGLVSP